MVHCYLNLIFCFTDVSCWRQAVIKSGQICVIDVGDIKYNFTSTFNIPWAYFLLILFLWWKRKSTTQKEWNTSHSWHNNINTWSTGAWIPTLKQRRVVERKFPGVTNKWIPLFRLDSSPIILENVWKVSCGNHATVYSILSVFFSLFEKCGDYIFWYSNILCINDIVYLIAGGRQLSKSTLKLLSFWFWLPRNVYQNICR